jgi:hypothetical protein
MECMGRSLSGCVWFAIQEEGDGDDDEEWSCINEPMWREACEGSWKKNREIGERQ